MRVREPRGKWHREGQQVAQADQFLLECEVIGSVERSYSKQMAGSAHQHTRARQSDELRGVHYDSQPPGATRAGSPHVRCGWVLPSSPLQLAGLKVIFSIMGKTTADTGH